MSSHSPGICMLNLNKHQTIIKSLQKLYDSKLFLEKLNTLLPYVDIIDIKSFLNMQTKMTEKKLFMDVSLHPNKKKIWTNKLNTFNKNFLNTELLKTLVQDSTLKEKDLSPFWTQSCIEKSKKLWLPIMTDLQELDLTLFCTYVDITTQSLPYSQIKSTEVLKENLQKNLSPSLPIILQNSMDYENTTYCRKIRFYPNSTQVKHLNNFFGTHRYLYNKTISYFNNKCENDIFSTSLATMRPILMKSNKDMDENDNEYWLKDIPYDTRQLAIKNALSSIKSTFELLKNKRIRHFHHKYKSKKDKKQVFFVDHRALKNLHLFPSLLKDDGKLKVENRYKKKYKDYIPEKDLIILRDGKKYFILFSKEKKFEKIEQNNKIISLDPGIKKFQSFYTPDGYCGSFGNNELKKKILKIETKVDKLKSIQSKSKDKKFKKRINEKCYKLKTKVKNIISDF